MKRRRSLEVLIKPLILLIFALLIGGGLFFRYDYRPNMIRAACSIEAEKRAENDPFVYEVTYRHCLRMNGVEYTDPKE